MTGFIDRTDIAIARKEGAELLAALREKIKCAQECFDEINALREELAGQALKVEEVVRRCWDWSDMPDEAIYVEVPGLRAVHRFFEQATDCQLCDVTIDLPSIGHFEALFGVEETPST